MKSINEISQVCRGSAITGKFREGRRELGDKEKRKLQSVTCLHYSGSLRLLTCFNSCSDICENMAFICAALYFARRLEPRKYLTHMSERTKCSQ